MLIAGSVQIGPSPLEAPLPCSRSPLHRRLSDAQIDSAAHDDFVHFVVAESDLFEGTLSTDVSHGLFSGRFRRAFSSSVANPVVVVKRMNPDSEVISFNQSIINPRRLRR